MGNVIETIILNGKFQSKNVLILTDPTDPFGLNHFIQTFAISNSLGIRNDY